MSRRSSKILEPYKRIFYYWAGVYRIKHALHMPFVNVPIGRLGAITDWHLREDMFFAYDLREWHRLKDQPYILLSAVFHELGHVHKLLPYNTLQQKVAAEWYAESFSLMVMKKFYKKEYADYVRYIKKENYMYDWLNKRDFLYYVAYLNIKEYRES